MTEKLDTQKLLHVLDEYNRLGITSQIDYNKFYLYSLITHSTAIEGSTVTEIENQLLFDEGIAAKGRTMQEQLMNLDLKKAYEQSMRLARLHQDFSVDLLKSLSAVVMANTGSSYNTIQGSFDASKGDLRLLLNVTAGAGGKSYMNFVKVPSKLEDFCTIINQERKRLLSTQNVIEQYRLSFDAHYRLVTIHPWADGNGRMSRLVMNQIQFEFGLVPSKVIKEDKADYIQALIESRECDESSPFCEFMFREHVKNLEIEIENYKESLDGSRKSSQKSSQKGSQKSSQKIIERMADNPAITTQELADELGVSRRTIAKHVKQLQMRGFVMRIGPDKGGHWEVVNSEWNEDE